MRVAIWFHSKSSLLYYYSEENEDEGGSYGYSNRTCWKVMTHARRLWLIPGGHNPCTWRGSPGSYPGRLLLRKPASEKRKGHDRYRKEVGIQESRHLPWASGQALHHMPPQQKHIHIVLDEEKKVLIIQKWTEGNKIHKNNVYFSNVHINLGEGLGLGLPTQKLLHQMGCKNIRLINPLVMFQAPAFPSN